MNVNQTQGNGLPAIANITFPRISQFVDAAAASLGLEVEWKGDGVEEKGYDRKTGKKIIEVDPRYFRPTEVEALLGDASKARNVLGWEPKTSFEDLVHEMAQEDLKLAQRDDMVTQAGFKAFDYFE